MTDPITDMLNRINNALAVFKETVEIPFANQKFEIAKILEKEGYIKSAEKKGRAEKKTIIIELKYQKDNTNKNKKEKPLISSLKRVSRPGQRIYTSYKNIKPVRGGEGIAIISTSFGLMTDKEAKKKKLGGEVICQIW